MPCFHGLAVSIHTPDGPLPEYSIQKQSKFHRITSYIPVPPPKVPAGSTTNIPEQSTFAISITLLTPGLNVPYSTPKPTPEDPYPRPRTVGGLPGYGGDRGKYGPVIGPYIPLTSSPNETVAAYIYFDGRAKEEVATLLRRGEETWVNSRWVSVPDSEGGGLAEREFLFREVGLERWLNTLDLEGKDLAKELERRRIKAEKRKKRRELRGSDEEEDKKKATSTNGVLRYGDNKNAPVESLSGDEDLFSTDSDSDGEPPMPEATGQIKVALFRVLASGEIKRGEYSPQFDAHDDSDGGNGNNEGGGSGTKNEGDVDHTTSFAKPKTLDPKTISTQTVTGIDPPDKPYAVFTFLYRGERQLRKMGILSSPKSDEKTAVSAKRKSTGLDLSGLKPLSNTGTRNFIGYRDPSSQSGKKSGKKGDDMMDSDADDEDDDRKAADEVEDSKETGKGLLSPEDALRQGELAEGVRKIKLKRQHSAEPLAAHSPASRNSPTNSSTDQLVTNAQASSSSDAQAGSNIPTLTPTNSSLGASEATSAPDQAIIGSPFKKQRASLPGFDETVRKGLGKDLLGRRASEAPTLNADHGMSEDEEL